MNNNEEILDSKIDDLYMVFVINNQKYALSSKYITEIIEILPITKVPFLPEYMKGIINLRSTIIPVMDARMRFGMEPIEYSERTCIIIRKREEYASRFLFLEKRKTFFKKIEKRY